MKTCVATSSDSAPFLVYGVKIKIADEQQYQVLCHPRMWVCAESCIRIERLCHKTSARQESSKFYSDLRNASSLELTKYYCINCHCSTVTMPIKLSSYVTWSTSETVASVQLPLNAVFFRLVEVVSHVIL